MLLDSLAMISGETLLSLYPVIVKTTNITIDWQVFSRLLVYSFIPLLFGSIFTSLTNISIWKWIFVGLINYLHIFTSYKGFQLLSPGLAMTFFYMYPIYNLLLLKAFFNYPLSFIRFTFFIIPVALVYSIFNDRKNEESSVDSSLTQNKLLGIFYVSLAAITESLIYIMLKTTNTGLNPWNSVFFVYFSSLVISLIILYFSKFYENFDNKKDEKNDDTDDNKNNDESEKYFGISKNFIKLSLINAFIGLIGYVLRFYAIPRLSPIIFSILSFTGIITSHIFGYLFFNEIISLKVAIKLVLLIISLISIKIYGIS
jgi:drug/metabolite transporter (DMT)-like permease